MDEIVIGGPLDTSVQGVHQLTGIHSSHLGDEDLSNQEALLSAWEELYEQAPKKTRINKLQRNPGESDYRFSYRLLYSYLIRKGMREIGQFQEMSWNEGTLGSVLFRVHMLNALKHAKREGGFDLLKKYLHYSDAAALAQMTGICRRAARFALENFDAETYKKKQQQGRGGGMAYRVWGLEEYLETYGMSKKETAKHLGISTSSVANMRKHFRKVLDINTGEILSDYGLGIHHVS